MIKKVLIKPKSIYAVLLLGIFTFLFLGSEYLYVNMISFTAGEEKTVIAQNYALGMSAVGFLLYPLFHRFRKKQAQIAGLFLLALAVAVCNFFVWQHVTYVTTLLFGMALFLLLGLLGSAVHYLFLLLVPDNDYLARMVGISYALGIFLQFLNNNLGIAEAAEAIVLSVFVFVVVALLLKVQRLVEQTESESEVLLSPLGEADEKAKRKKYPPEVSWHCL